MNSTLTVKDLEKRTTAFFEGKVAGEDSSVVAEAYLITRTQLIKLNFYQRILKKNGSIHKIFSKTKGEKMLTKFGRMTLRHSYELETIMNPDNSQVGTLNYAVLQPTKPKIHSPRIELINMSDIGEIGVENVIVDPFSSFKTSRRYTLIPHSIDEDMRKRNLLDDIYKSSGF